MKEVQQIDLTKFYQNENEEASQQKVHQQTWPVTSFIDYMRFFLFVFFLIFGQENES